MSAVLTEFRKEMAAIRQQAKGDDRKELIRLLLMALEREELVTVSYRESLMGRQVDEMAIPVDVKELIRSAVVWIWRDEDMHTQYTRAALLRIGNFWLRIRAFMAQATGAIGGWATSVIQHVRFWRSPGSWCFARLFMLLGKFLGKLPKEVGGKLKHGSFKTFCEVNVDLEVTAWACWERIVELADHLPEFSEERVRDLRKVIFDEDRHGKVFGFIGEALDHENQMIPGITANSLAEQIRSVSFHFLPQSFRDHDPLLNPLGAGGTVWALEDNAGRGKIDHFLHTLEQSDLAQRLEQIRQTIGKSPREMKVAIKVNFMLGCHQKDLSPITDPETLEALARWLHDKGYSQLKVIDTENLYDRFFDNRSVLQVAEYFGYGSDGYTLVDASNDHIDHTYQRGMGAYAVSQTWKQADFRITVGKLKTHPQELVFLSLSNLEWLGSRCEDLIFIDKEADRHNTTMMLLDEFPPHFSLIEGYDQCPDGIVGMMGCKKPRSPKRFYAGADALAVDMVAARHMGLQKLPDSGVLNAANHWFGGWAKGINVIGTDTRIKDWKGPTDSRWWAFLSFLSFPMYTFFSGRGKLFIAETDEAAFPPKERFGLLTRIAQGLNRWFIGLSNTGRK